MSRPRPDPVTHRGSNGPWHRFTQAALTLGLTLSGTLAVSASNCLDGLDGSFTLNLNHVEVTPDLRLNGAPFVTSEAHSVEIWLAQQGILQVKLGDTHLPAQAVQVITGTYELVYRNVSSSSVVLPQNEQFVFQENVVIDSPGVLVADVISVTVSGQITLNGAAFPGSVYERGAIWAVDPSYGGDVLLGHTHTPPLSAVLVAGNYDIVYRHQNGSSIVPGNQNAVITNLDLQPGNGTISENLIAHEVSGDIYYNGNPPPASIYEQGTLQLRRSSADGLEDIVELGDTHEQSYSAIAIAGTYDVHFLDVNSDSLSPNNVHTVALRNKRVNGSPLNIDIPRSSYTGNILLNGATPPASIYENGELFFLDRETGAETPIGNTADGTHSFTAIPGTYDLVYRLETGDDLVPMNDRVVFESEREFLYGGQFVVPLPIDIPMTAVTIDMQQDGQAWSQLGGSATVRLMNSDATMSFLLGSTLDSPWTVNLVSGSYVVTYSRDSGAGIPQNLLSRLPALLSFSGPSDSVTINLQTVQITPTVLLNGNPFPGAESATFSLLSGGGLLPFGSGGSWPAQNALQAGYLALYSHDTGTTIPDNIAHQQNCINAEGCLFCDGYEDLPP